MTPNSRPVTSKPRGVCKYYLTPRGCWADKKCKYLHGESATHTPYDLSKPCRFFALGFCKRGDKCWFSHDSESAAEEDNDLCSVCLEKATTYGLLTGCNHVFCITCIKQWRSTSNPDVVESGNTKRCPMCRTASKFIIPSSKFYPQGPEKDKAIERYKTSMKRIPCRHFQQSLTNRTTGFCKYGRDCFYLHRNPDGSEHVSSHGIESFRIGSVLSDRLSARSEIIRSLETVLAETARLGLTAPFQEGDADDGAAVMHRLELLADHMLSLAVHDPIPTEEGLADDDAYIPAQSEEDIPMLASVSNSTASIEGSDAEDDGLPTLEPLGEARVPPPFLTDGRGRVVWSTNNETVVDEGNNSGIDEDEAPQATRSDAEDDGLPTLEPLGEARVPPPFLTDGRGRVVWSTNNETVVDEGNNSGIDEDEAPQATRSFLGRMFNALF
ncbi:hypothetical protein MIND_00339900 [Mycena indigotica]|uniref:RING-type E3 ubiquitin transferase n=1 Tax=Mycena indigotica TaxID=2126181 RepID=A0A8H6T5A8_9AGAR|nr:uncharacterized protein MIND_00339900 [Mycena indigotica]KAF7309685.1 hypothetical protein MIND_00339900 [Mycena indigotica]